MGDQLSCLAAPIEDNNKDTHSSNDTNSSHSHSSHSHKYSSICHPSHKHRVKILFLDVDGVLNGENIGYGGVDDSLLFLLKTIIDETGCKIVLSTTWRLNQSARALLLHFMKARADINVEDIIIGDTPSLKNQNRACEIQSFLESFEFQSQYYCHSWCAIDDLNLMHYSQTYMNKHFVRTNYRTGLTSNDAYKVVQILNREEISNSYDYEFH